MIIRKLFILNLLIFYTAGVCIHILKYRRPTDVIANCNDVNFTVDPKHHKVEWGSFDQIFDNKYPYLYLNNGSLLIRAVSESSSHYLCEVKDIATNKSLHRCGTSVIIIQPLVLKFTPVNETVKRGSQYRINCHGGGGDFNNWQLMYFVNDIRVSSDSPFPIYDDTKVECRLVSGNESLSSIAYIKVKKDGILTDEEKLVETKCNMLTNGICYEKFPENSYRVFSSYVSSRQIIEDILKELFQMLDNQIIGEYNEDKCVDRFQRLVCSTLYSPCNSNLGNAFVKKSVCSESCDTILETVCRNTVQRIKPLFDNIIKHLITTNDKSDDFSVPEYRRRYVTSILQLTKSVFDCKRLPSFRNRTKSEECTLLNLDVIPAPMYKPEKPSSKCYNNVGRNYTGEISQNDMNPKCIEWRRIPQLYVAFYQQNLQNQSSYCRNPGGIFNWPMCPVATIKTYAELNLNYIKLIPCSHIYSCEFWQILKSSHLEKGSIGIIVIVGSVIFVIVLSVIIGLSKRLRKPKKKSDRTDDIALNDEEIQLFHNKVFMYKNVQNGYYSCPIYNSACLERVFRISNGAYGEILLVQAVFEDSPQLITDESTFSTIDRNNNNTKNISESDNNSMDDFILSKDKTFNSKPCWPFDKSSASGSCPFAVIKYCMPNGEQTIESQFAQETKILSQLNHPNIMRFYGVTVNSTGKIISRIIEYLPNGTLYSILTNDRPKPLVADFHDKNKLENGYQKLSALQNCHTKDNNNSVSTTDQRPIKRKKTMSSHSKEIEPPRQTEHIELNIRQLVKWITEICDAVVYLHSKHLLHRDIATRNCLVGVNLETKLSDFNLVHRFTIGHDLLGSKHEFIPIRWLPKETLENMRFNIDTDVWMFGVFMWEVMSFGKLPYHNLDLNETFDAITNGVLLEIPEKCSEEIYEQMKLCWSEPHTRPYLETIKKNLTKILDKL